MKYFSLFLLLLCLASCGHQAPNPLFLIQENGKLGFMDSTGKVMIAPKFHNAGEFSDGLANVRINGKYGYIDETGNFAISPQFEYATPFSEGLAIVYNSGKYFFIDHTGKKAFQCAFPYAQPFKHGLSIVSTSSNKYGAIDKHGKLLIDTAYSEIYPFEDGMTILQKLQPEDKSILGVVDTLGRMVVPFGKFEHLSNYSQGIFQSMLHPESKDQYKFAFVDKKGKIVSSWEYSSHFNLDGRVSCGMTPVSLVDFHDDAGNYIADAFYKGYMNLEGKITIKDTNIKIAHPFSDNRAFMGSDYRTLKIIDTKGKNISKHTFSNRLGDFENGIAFVECYNRWGMIDTNGRFTKWPSFSGTPVCRYEDFVVYTNYNPKKDKHLSGILTSTGKTLVKNIIEEMDSRGFVNGLLKCTIDGRLTYINRKGKTVWQERKRKTRQLFPLNVDYMLTAHFQADSVKVYDPFGYEYQPDPVNPPHRIADPTIFPKDKLSLIVSQEVDTIFGELHPGFTVQLANATSGYYKFNTQVGRLNMVVQAMNPDGEWQDIEYVWRSWCGTSSFQLRLPPGHYWKFVTPQMSGDYQTKLRIALKYIDPRSAGRDANEIRIYSNEYDGSVNPAQFWNQLQHQSAGLMDPFY